MADGKFLIGKPAGGVTTVTMTDGASNTNLVLPESGTVATEAYADGKTTLAQVKAEISTGSNLITSPTGAIGYGTGAGGTVTQLTNKSTAVVLNKSTGKIIMSNSALAAGGTVSFALTNTVLSANDTISFNLVGGYAVYATYTIDTNTTNGSLVRITVNNISAGSLSEALILKFSIIKGAVA